MNVNCKALIVCGFALGMALPASAGFRIGGWRVRFGGDADKVTDQAAKPIEDIKDNIKKADAWVEKSTGEPITEYFKKMTFGVVNSYSGLALSSSTIRDDSSGESDEDTDSRDEQLEESRNEGEENPRLGTFADIAKQMIDAIYNARQDDVGWHEQGKFHVNEDRRIEFVPDPMSVEESTEEPAID
jgi:hypothetical protein